MAVPLAPSAVARRSRESDPNRQALASIDAVHNADPAVINEQVASLRRFVRIRRILYYTVLAPAAWVSRRSPLLVLLSGAAAVVGLAVAVLAGAPLLLTVALAYWAVAALSYHALSVRLASLIQDAAKSVGWESSDVLTKWKG